MKTGKMIAGIIISLLILIISQTLAELAGSLLMILHMPVFACNIFAGALYIVFAYVILKIFSEKFIKCKLNDLAITPVRSNIKAKWIISALALPVMVTLIYLLLPGEIKSSSMSAANSAETVCAGVFFTGLGAGIVEEMVFRGVIMNLLLSKFGKKIAIIVPSLLFGIVHIIGMDFSLLSCIQVILAGTMTGIMFSLIALESGSVWNSAVVHAVWNTIIVGGIFSVGGEFNELSLYSYVLNSKSFAITGGEFGIESSLIAVTGYVLVALFAVMSSNRAEQ